MAGSTSEHLSPQRPSVHPPSLMSAFSRPTFTQTYNEMHGLVVQVGKHVCFKQEPHCSECPLQPLLPAASCGFINILRA